jgi:hypothetical protein
MKPDIDLNKLSDDDLLRIEQLRKPLSWPPKSNITGEQKLEAMTILHNRKKKLNHWLLIVTFFILFFTIVIGCLEVWNIFFRFPPSSSIKTNQIQPQ